MQEIRKANLFTSLLPQHLHRVNLISENICSKECWYSYCYGNQIGHYFLYSLVYDGWLKWNTSISLTETETKVGLQQDDLQEDIPGKPVETVMKNPNSKENIQKKEQRKIKIL